MMYEESGSGSNQAEEVYDVVPSASQVLDGENPVMTDGGEDVYRTKVSYDGDEEQIEEVANRHNVSVKYTDDGKATFVGEHDDVARVVDEAQGVSANDGYTGPSDTRDASIDETVVGERFRGRD
jgi:hypothetical protein